MKFPRRFQRYALEFLTVFLGVSLSLLAENWRQRRADSRAEHDSLIRVYGDMRNEERDMNGNAGRAETGLRDGRWILTNGAASGSPDSVSNALTGIGVCSFLIPYTSEYTALKSSGRLSVIEDDVIRQNIVHFYEQESFVEWLHERDCILTGDLMDSVLGKFEFAEARNGSRYPRIIFHSGQQGLLKDAAFRDRIVRLGAQRQYLVDFLKGRIVTSEALRGQIRERLGKDTLTLNVGTRAGFGNNRPDSLRRRPRRDSIGADSTFTDPTAPDSSRGRGRGRGRGR